MKLLSKSGFWRLALAMSFMVITSCGNGEDLDANPNASLSQGSWQVGNTIYQRGVSIQETSKPDPNGPTLRTFVISTTGSANQGPFSGSSITGYLYEQGAGEYKIVSEDFFFEEGHTGKFITFTCSIGIGVSSGSTLYGTSDNQEVVAVSLRNSDYVMTMDEEVILNKELDVNGGVSGAKQQYPFKANSIF